CSKKIIASLTWHRRRGKNFDENPPPPHLLFFPSHSHSLLTRFVPTSPPFTCSPTLATLATVTCSGAVITSRQRRRYVFKSPLGINCTTRRNGSDAVQTASSRSNRGCCRLVIIRASSRNLACSSGWAPAATVLTATRNGCVQPLSTASGPS